MKSVDLSKGFDVDIDELSDSPSLQDADLILNNPIDDEIINPIK